MADTVTRGDIHLGRNIDALQHQLGVTDEDMLATLGLSYNRFWDMKRRDWAQKKTVAQVASALTELSGLSITASQVLSGRLEPEQYAARAVEEFIRLAGELGSGNGIPVGGVRLPRLGLETAGPEGAEVGTTEQIVSTDPGDCVVTAPDAAMLPTIAPGDELVCRLTGEAADGAVVVASYLLEDGIWRSGVRRLRCEGDLTWLMCDNQSADPYGQRLFPDEHPAGLTVHGQVTGVWRNLS